MKLGTLLDVVSPGQDVFLCVPKWGGDDDVLYHGDIEEVPSMWDDIDVCYAQTSAGNEYLQRMAGSSALCIGIEHG